MDLFTQPLLGLQTSIESVVLTRTHANETPISTLATISET